MLLNAVPLAGNPQLVTLKVCAASGSVIVRQAVTGTSSGVVSNVSFTVGAQFTCVIVTEVVTVQELASETVTL